ncbi:hypothetical protein HDR70_02030 [bacterium]|nr:hypothetical protein [bacterium]
MKIIPNTICEGIGETPLEVRIEPWMQEARQWFCREISPEELLSEQMLPSADTIIQCRALWNAAPALDVTMHPNGLAVVNTDSLVPASAERSAEFRKSIMKLMMDTITNLLPQLHKIPGWSKSNPSIKIWRATVYRTPQDICTTALLPYEWDSIHTAVATIRSIEDHKAATVWSPEMLAVIRNFDYGNDDLMRTQVILQLRNCIRTAVSSIIPATQLGKVQTANSAFLIQHLDNKIAHAIEQYINICRDNPDICHAWHHSKTASLYNPTPFRNKKDSSAYFF